VYNFDGAMLHLCFIDKNPCNLETRPTVVMMLLLQQQYLIVQYDML